MSKKKYRPKVDKNKSAQHSPADPQPNPDGNGHRLVNANDFEARKEGIMEVVNRYNAEREATEQPKFDAHFWERAKETISRTAKLIGEEAKAEETRRTEKADTQPASPKPEEPRDEAGGNGGHKETAQPKRDDLDDWMSGLSDAEVKAWREYAETMLERLEYHVHGVSSGEGPLSDDEVKGYLANGVRYLNQTVKMTSHVLDTVDVKTLRRIVASDTDATSLRKALKILGRDPDEVLGPEASDGRLQAAETANDHRPSSASGRQDWRKRPRGRRHPLLQLVTLACSSVRLINQITRETNPHAHNRLTLEEREDRRFERVLGGIATDVERIAKR